jgi:hypothetical protein
MYDPRADSATPFRVYRAEARLIHAGLRSLLVRQDLHERGILTTVHPNFVLSPDFDRGEFNRDQVAIITHTLYQTRLVGTHSKRVRLDAVEIASCMFAVRVTGTLLRHKHLKAWQPGLPVATRRLIRKLEVHRKRAKRAYIQVQGPLAFTEASRRWSRFVRWARIHLLYCPCGRTILSGSRRRRQRFREQLVGQWLELIREEFPDFSRAASGESEVRDVIMRAFRSAARARRKIGYPTMRRDRDFVRDRIHSFIARQCSRQGIMATEGNAFNNLGRIA